jgi:transposase-like protein
MARKTTLEERIEIIKYLIKHELDYHGTAIKFNVSYQQVYTWYKKYQALGVNGLNDKRGRKKQVQELSELEQLRRENERLKRDLYLSEAAKEVFKKKQELEAKAHLTRLGTKKHTKQ